LACRLRLSASLTIDHETVMSVGANHGADQLVFAPAHAQVIEHDVARAGRVAVLPSTATASL
jgi:hypothetical protein